MKLPSIQENNRNAVFLLGALAGIGGSIVTIMLAASSLWALARLVFRTIPYRIARSDMVFLGAATAYFAANALLSLARDPLAFTSPDLLPIGVFLAGWLMIPRLRMSESESLIDMLVLGAALCALLVLPVAVWQALYLNIRAEGGAGNPLPFALICCVFGLLSLVNTLHEKPWRKALGWAGFVGGVACLMLSQSKGLLPVALSGFVAFLVIFPRVLRGCLTGRGLAAIGLALAVMVVSAVPFHERLQSAFAYFTSSKAHDSDKGSYDAREALWRHAGTLIAEHPIAGHGVQNRRALVASAGFPYTHFHNGFLTSLVDTGAIGFLTLCALLAAPLVTALRAARGDWYRQRIFVGLVLFGTYAIGGMTNLIFWQDIYDSVFLWIAIIVSVSVPVSAANPLVIGRGQG
ncbi:O-antigen ligase family protein [Rhizobium sp. RU36D]|uniref:O-antigen ligase family protein n=1 Tax=Rhizobium sp. RU36D TaxID=1907415 RepID=UPI0015C4A139|nr:O-antigen ligase family protein [Rhizobium sp. RU36D]